MIFYEPTKKPEVLIENILVDGVKIGETVPTENGFCVYVMPITSEHVMCFGRGDTKEKALENALIKVTSVSHEMLEWLKSLRGKL